jgi:hypothetical protein
MSSHCTPWMVMVSSCVVAFALMLASPAWPSTGHGRCHTPLGFSHGGSILLLLLYFSRHQDNITLYSARRLAHINSRLGSSLTVHTNSCSPTHSDHGIGLPAASHSACPLARHSIFCCSSQICFCFSSCDGRAGTCGSAYGLLFCRRCTVLFHALTADPPVTSGFMRSAG